MESRAERRMSLWRGRRESVWRGRRESVWGGRRESLWRGQEDEDSAQAGWRGGFRPKLANTYRLEPLHPFAPHLLRRGAEELLGAFGDLQYQQESCRRLARRVADQLLALAKEQVFDRYRYIVQVSVGQKLGQGVKIASKALWDHEKDSFITLRYRYIVQVSVGQKLGQGVKIASKALWDHEKDIYNTLHTLGLYTACPKSGPDPSKDMVFEGCVDPQSLNRNETVCRMVDFLSASQHRCSRPHRCITKRRQVKFF